jgi:hypothetical protein
MSRDTLTTGRTFRLRLTPSEILDTLPEALHANAMGTWTPDVPHDTAEKNALWGPLIESDGELGQVWHVSSRGLVVILAIDPDGTRTAWALINGDDTLDTGTHEGRMSIGEALDIIHREEGV